MKISIISFTKTAARLNKKIRDRMTAEGKQIVSYSKGKNSCEPGIIPVIESVTEWTGEMFESQDAIIFIGACAIAVRSIAPYLVNKSKDPAVLVIDEKGNYVIPILSGHIGGANELAMETASVLGAIPVITTATDLNGKFAVDVFAAKNRLHISDMMCAKEISAAILNGEVVGFASELPVEGRIPPELNMSEHTEYGIRIALNELPVLSEKTLQLTPKIVTIGIGCRKDKDPSDIEKALLSFLDSQGIPMHAVERIASIDLKKDEKGILDFAHKYKIPLSFHSAEELGSVRGAFSESEFVESVTGVSGVCERAAVLAGGNCTLMVRKTIINGVTLAAAVGKRSVRFE
ncbi:cobalt-precorrin 5A hydrolase [Parasporobacterium paucivorans]|uniref:Cobalt-precorrin 5A hydrolase n=1 Tax=Parasporobacterium paucivorans DSM 15970 TaxID=1122934 RepID=A0A1M6DTZ5_9FIRM|nr:cobalt-precorrin 5A hydrolase [Parasporobacterium paucivorans]SHI76488.1 cobalt-precorrin 5A hydrolase [Parasporobacterium paucivorans DSM 15970]